MSGACFANDSDFSYWRDLVALDRQCPAHVLQMIPIFLLEGPGGIGSATSGACFANDSDFSYWRDPAALSRQCPAHVLQVFPISYSRDPAALDRQRPAHVLQAIPIFPTGGTWRH
jgi:hypothetical protein